MDAGPWLKVPRQMQCKLLSACSWQWVVGEAQRCWGPENLGVWGPGRGGGNLVPRVTWVGWEPQGGCGKGRAAGQVPLCLHVLGMLSREWQWAPDYTREPQHSVFHQCLQEGRGPGVLSLRTLYLGSGRPGSSSLLTSAARILASMPVVACCLCQEVALIFMGNESFDGAAFSQVVEASHGLSGEPCLPCPLGQRFPDQVPDGLQVKHRAGSSLWG